MLWAITILTNFLSNLLRTRVLRVASRGFVVDSARMAESIEKKNHLRASHSTLQIQTVPVWNFSMPAKLQKGPHKA